MKYRLADPRIDDHQIKMVEDVLKSKMLVHGASCETFEADIASYLGVEKEQVAVTSSCTASLHLALLSLNVPKNKAIMVPSFTFPATVNVVEQIGAIPIFVDVNEDDYTMSVESLRNTYDSFKKDYDIVGIIVVHEFGASADMNQIMTFAKGNGLFVIEDAACAFGTEFEKSKVGLLSDIGCFSFHPRKAITTGEGGAVVSNNKDLIKKCKTFRNHGMDMVNGHIDFVVPGLNYRLTHFQAVLCIGQLQHFDDWISKRRTLQLIYRTYLKHPMIHLPKDQEGHTWQSFMIVLDDRVNRDMLKENLKLKENESNYGAYSLLETQYYKEKYGNLYAEKTPISTKLFRQGLCLPLHQGLSEEDIKTICKEVLSCLEAGYGY